MMHLGDIAEPRTVPHGLPGPTLPLLLAAQAATRPEAIALLHKRQGLWRRWTWRGVAAEAADLAAAIAGYGVAQGGSVVIAGESRPRLLIALLACQSAGTVPVLVPQEGAGVKLEHVLAEHDPSLAFVAGKNEALAIATSCRATVVCDDPRGVRSLRSAQVRTWDEFTGGARASAPAQAVPSDPAAIVYAPGTEDGYVPVVLSHAALVAQAETAVRRFALSSLERALIMVPFGWAEALLLGPAQALQAGFALAFPESDATVLRDLREAGPSVLFGPPVLYRRLRQEAFLASARAGWPWRGLFARRLEFDDGEAGASNPGPLARALIVGPTRDRLGLSNLRAAISFGGIVPLRVARFFNALGVAVRPLDDDADFPGPAKIEAALRGSVYIRDAAVVRTQTGDWAALVSPDREAVASWAEARGNLIRSSEQLGALDDVRVLIGREIAAASRGQRDGVATFLIATPDFSVASGELSAQGELRRDAMEDLRSASLAALRAGKGERVDGFAAPVPRQKARLALANAVPDGAWT